MEMVLVSNRYFRKKKTQSVDEEGNELVMDMDRLESLLTGEDGEDWNEVE